ncbi:N-acyl-aromatic-L-amino acid amidohydrolase (carboxylate-forming) B-like isoform X1 [Sardina pilchardus]|uniref:N-acyl-aromatic-L-amino acid amidohydrolase (carboxylate-forming) B-like isoform X1 n=2 Tax=Sardina pilchardus TaxID=27697 RepID=UPI002E129E1A
MMELLTLPALHRMAICGGTHGNEMTGVYLVQEMARRQKEEGEKAWPLPIKLVLSNPQAIEQCRRYSEADLNRCFTSAILRTPITDSSPYELRRAHELNALLGPKESEEAVDILCDLHNTTSNMGVTLISYSLDEWISLHIYKYIKMKMTSAPVRLFMVNIPNDEAYSLESVGKNGFSLEVGPQPHGVLRADIYNYMKEALDLAIEWIGLFNSGTVIEGGEVEAYLFHKSIDYPRDPDSQQISAAIHPQLQDQDFCCLKPGDPMFQCFSGDTVCYKEEESLHPFFINECAYYEKGIAFHLARKATVKIPSVKVQIEDRGTS